MVGAIGSLIIGRVEAALMTRRSRGPSRLASLDLACAAPMVCLALALSAIVLAAPGFAITATLGAGTIGAYFAINYGGEAEGSLMLSRVEWVTQTVTWTNRVHSTPSTQRRRGHRAARPEPEE